MHTNVGAQRPKAALEPPKERMMKWPSTISDVAVEWLNGRIIYLSVPASHLGPVVRTTMEKPHRHNSKRL